MPSGPFDEPAAPLTARERRVLAALEAELADVRPRWWQAVLRALAVIVPLAALTVALAVTVALTTSPGVATAVTGLASTVSATAAAVLVFRQR